MERRIHWDFETWNFRQSSKVQPPATSHQNFAIPSFIGFTYSLYSALPPSACQTCRQHFTSRNTLLVHLNATKHFLKSIPKAKTSSQIPSPGTIISSYAPFENV